MTHRRLLTALMLLLATGLTFGDKIILHDGTEFEGTVVSEEGDSYVVEYQRTPTIKDRKTIKKADVKSVARTSPEEIAFKSIEGLVPTADRLSTADYDRMINKQVKAFSEAFPRTLHKPKVAEILAILTKERDYRNAGGLKLDGKWIKPDERAANAYEIDARLLYADIKAAAAAKKYKDALRKFEEFETDFMASESYEKTVETAKSVLTSYRPMIASGLRRVDASIAKRNSELERLPANQRAAALADIRRRATLYAKVIEQEKNRQTKWLTVEQYHRGPMEDVLRNIESERKRLEVLVIDQSKLAGTAYRDAYAAAAAGDEEASRTHFSALQSRGIPERYIESLNNRLAAQLEAAAAAAATEPDTPEPDPDGADTEGDSSGEDMPDGEGARDSGDAETSAATDTADSPAPLPVAPDTADEGGGFKKILLAVMVLVLVIAGVAIFTGAKKKK